MDTGYGDRSTGDALGTAGMVDELRVLHHDLWSSTRSSYTLRVARVPVGQSVSRSVSQAWQQSFTCKHLHKLGTHGTEEGDPRLSSNGTGQVGLACAWGALEDDALQQRLWWWWVL